MKNYKYYVKIWKTGYNKYEVFILFRKIILPSIITLLLGAVNYYITLPALNIKSVSFWGFLFFLVIVWVLSRVLLAGAIKIFSVLKGETKTQFNKEKVLLMVSQRNETNRMYTYRERFILRKQLSSL